MITEQTVNKICIERGMSKMSISKIPTWIDHSHQEGIEFHQITKEIKPFWIVAGERNYIEPTGISILKTIELIKTEKTEQKEEMKEEKTELPEITKNGNDLPEFLTPALLTKWGQMKTIDRMLMFQRTPKDKIKQVAVSKTEKANYVEGNYMVKEANAAFLFDWEFELQDIKINPENVAVIGKIKANIDGKYITRPAIGYETTNTKMTVNLAIKSATTDAIKKGLSLFGFNSDVYSGEI